MKRIIKYLLIILLANLFFIPTVNASGGINVSTRNLTLVKGGSATFSIIASNAVGRVDITTSNPSVASISETSVWLDNNSQVITVRAVGAGNAAITVKVVDGATFDEEVLSNIYTINVSVSNPAPPPSPSPSPSPSSNPGSNQGSNQNSNQTTPPPNPSTEVVTKSSNNNLKSLTVEGYKVETSDKVNYSLSVNNSVEKIKINAVAEDSKAKITGAGEVRLNVGNNKYQITVTAENGAVKTYTLTVNRKGNEYTMDDVDYALSEKTNTITIKIEDGDVLDKREIEKIHNSGKTINLVKYDDANNISYQLVIDGNKLLETDDMRIDIDTTFSNKEEFDKVIGYREGKYVEYTSNLPKGSKLRLNVSDQYDDGDLVNIYTYDKDVKIIKKSVKVEQGIVEIELSDAKKYFVTKASLGLDLASLDIFKILCIAEAAIILLLLILLAKKKKNKNVSVQTPQQPTNTMINNTGPFLQ